MVNAITAPNVSPALFYNASNCSVNVCFCSGSDSTAIQSLLLNVHLLGLLPPSRTFEGNCSKVCLHQRGTSTHFLNFLPSAGTAECFVFEISMATTLYLSLKVSLFVRYRPILLQHFREENSRKESNVHIGDTKFMFCLFFLNL